MIHLNPEAIIRKTATVSSTPAYKMQTADYEIANHEIQIDMTMCASTFVASHVARYRTLP